MHIKRRYRRIIATILIFSIVLTSVSLPDTKVSAQTTTHGSNSTTLPKSGDWTDCIQGILPWNYFHNAVQEDIRKRNSFIEPGELPINYKPEQTNRKKGTTSGRADLYQIKGSFTYIWEVKPISYMVEPKLSEAFCNNRSTS